MLYDTTVIFYVIGLCCNMLLVVYMFYYNYIYPIDINIYLLYKIAVSNIYINNYIFL